MKQEHKSGVFAGKSSGLGLKTAQKWDIPAVDEQVKENEDRSRRKQRELVPTNVELPQERSLDADDHSFDSR